MYVLYFGNRNYSSWSLRAWLMLKGFDIPFEERVVALAGQGASDVHRAYSDNGLVPCLHDGAIRVWETLAIAEYLAERHAGLWPADAAARANARSVSAEMHAGFTALRSAMPMNIKLRLEGRPPASAVQRDIERIAETDEIGDLVHVLLCQHQADRHAQPELRLGVVTYGDHAPDRSQNVVE